MNLRFDRQVECDASRTAFLTVQVSRDSYQCIKKSHNAHANINDHAEVLWFSHLVLQRKNLKKGKEKWCCAMQCIIVIIQDWLEYLQSGTATVSDVSEMKSIQTKGFFLITPAIIVLE